MSELGVSPDAMAGQSGGLNLPSVLDLPRCINCIYAFEDGIECLRKPFPEENGIVCGEGMFAIGAISNRQLVTYLGWWETAIAMEGKEGAITPETVRAVAHSSGTKIVVDIKESDSLGSDAWGAP